MVEMGYDEIFKYLPIKMKRELIRKRIYFEQKGTGKIHKKREHGRIKI